MTIKERTGPLTKAATHVVRTTVQTRSCVWVCRLLRVTLMLRVWRSITWLFCLPLSLLLVLPTQHPHLAATASLVYFVSVSPNSSLQWLRNNWRPPAVSVAPFISFFRPSAPAAGVAHLSASQELPPRNANISNRCKHQGFFAFSRSPFHVACCFSLPFRLHTSAQHIRPTQNPCAYVGPLPEEVATCCCVYSLAPPNNYSVDLLTRAAQRRSCYSVSTAAEQPRRLQKKISVHFLYRYATRLIASTGSSSTEAVKDSHFTHYIPPISQNHVAALRTVTPALSDTRRGVYLKFCCTGGVHKCHYSLNFGLGCAVASVTPAHSTARGATSVLDIHLDDHAADFYTPRRKKKYDWPGRTRNVRIPFPKKSGGRLLFLSAGGAAAVSLGGAAAAAINSPSATKSPAPRPAFASAGGGGGGAAAVEGSATGNRRPFSIAAVRGILSARSAVRQPPSLSSNASTRVLPGAALGAPSASSPPAAAEIVVGGPAAGALTTPVSLAAAEAREASLAALGTSTSKQAQFSSAESPSPLEPALYPFTDIEEKWARYYAEHSDDFSPPLPSSEPVDDKYVFAEYQSRLSSSPPTVASRCVTGSYVRSAEFASETSQARESCEKPWTPYDPLSHPISIKLNQDVASHAHLSTNACESLHLHSQDIGEAARVAAKTAVSPKSHVDEAGKVAGLNVGSSAFSAQVDVRAETFRKSATGTSPLNPPRSVEVPAAARCMHGTHGQHNPVEQVQHVEVTGATTDAGCTTSCSKRQGYAEHVDTQEQRRQNLKEANTDAELRKLEKKSVLPCAAAEPRKSKEALLPNTEEESETRIAAPAAGEQERKKYYVLSMIPYPSGEGLHLGHCLTYTVADVVARYKRLQLRGELLRSQESRNGVTNVEREEEKEDGERHQIQQQRQQEENQEVEMRLSLQKRGPASELLSTGGTNVVVEKLTSEGNALTYDHNFEQGSCEQACRQVRDKDEVPSSRIPVHAVRAPVTDSATAGEDSRPTGLGRPAQTGGEKGGGAMLKQKQEEKQQVIPRASQQPDVMHVMGWDAFGLPAEQHALVSGIPPRLSVRKNIERFRHQLQRLGLSVDWRREIDTSDPKYFRWTQWIFLQMWKRGLVYEKAASVNWCEALGTVLANEEVVNGVSTRGQHPVEKKCLKQWHLRITAYADELEKSLDSLDWPDDVKIMQRNWIGKREVLYVNLPLLHPSVAGGKRLLTRENRSADGQAARGPTLNALDESRMCSSSPRKTSYACDFSRSANSSSQNDRTNCHNTFTPSPTDHGGCGAAVSFTTERAGGTPFSEKVDRYPHLLRCVSVSPEFLFGVTYIVMHAAHKQARAAAVTSAARRWLSAQNGDPTVGQDWHFASASHVEANELPSRVQKSTSTTKQTARSLTEAEILTESQREAAVGDQYEAVTENNDCMHISKISNAFFGKESVFSGSWVKHPLTGTALPVWLFSGKLFDKLRGAGTYLLERDAVLVVPEQDSVAEAFARAAGLPIISVFASGADVKGASDVKRRKAGGSEVLRESDKHYVSFNEKGRIVDRPVQGVIINSQSDELRVNGLSRIRARRQILAHLLARNIGEQQSVFALRDWVFSRQRFWGEPIPLIRAYAEDGTASVLPESEARLPVILPEKLHTGRLGIRKRHRSSSDEVPPTGFSSVEHKRSKNLGHGEKELHFSATGSISAEGDSERYLQRDSLMAPLAGYPQWWNIAPGTISNTSTPVRRPSQPTGEDTAGVATVKETDEIEKTRRMVKLQREVSTMPQWAGSSWYFLRFLDPHNTHDAFDKGSARYWMPVDLYVGGKEHAVTHLLYARFWHKVLRDIGLVTCGEPFKRLCTPGIMLGTPQYVAFQRIDTGEWVSASSVSLKKGSFLETYASQEARKSKGAAKQGVMPETAHSTTNFETARPLSIDPGHHDGAFSTAESVVNTTAGTPRTIREIAGESEGTRLNSTSKQDTVAGVHSPSGQPVREVEIESAAVTHVKGSDAPVLKEDEKIEVVCRYEKMSKSRGNVVSPDSLIHAYGADALRLHLLFMGPVEARKVWSVDGIKGVSRFLNRVWQLVVSGSKTGVPQFGRAAPVPPEDSSSLLPDVAPAAGEDQFLKTKFKRNDYTEYSAECTRGHEYPSTAHSGNSPAADCPGEERATSFLHKNDNCSQLQNSKLSAFENTLLKQLIERVTLHIERLTFNTAVAALMSAVKKLNQWNLEGNALSVHAALILVKLLHPFAPFITEELWFRIHERFPNLSKYATSPSLLACGVWPTNRDLEINTHGSANDEPNTAGEWGPCREAAAGTEPAVDVSVYFDGKLHVKVQVPVVLVRDKSTLEEYVKRDTQVAKMYQGKRILRSVVLLKAKLVNFVTRRINCTGDVRKKWN